MPPTNFLIFVFHPLKLGLDSFTYAELPAQTISRLLSFCATVRTTVSIPISTSMPDPHGNVPVKGNSSNMTNEKCMAQS